jgi:hypothetical protein
MKFFYLGMIILLFANCLPNNDTVPAWDAQTQINAAAEYKAKECNGPVPQPPLYVINDQIKRNLDLCSIAITRLECPFNGYPIICMGIYLEKPVPEFPWYVNFNELTKTRF